MTIAQTNPPMVPIHSQGSTAAAECAMVKEMPCPGCGGNREKQKQAGLVDRALERHPAAQLGNALKTLLVQNWIRRPHQLRHVPLSLTQTALPPFYGNGANERRKRSSLPQITSQRGWIDPTLWECASSPLAAALVFSSLAEDGWPTSRLFFARCGIPPVFPSDSRFTPSAWRSTKDVWSL